MKIMTILGTRPEIIRLSLIIKKLDLVCEHILVHTGQNYSESLSDIFFKDLNIRSPNYNLNVPSDSFGNQLSIILREIQKILIKEKPNKVLILGDTNSGLSAIISERMGIPVYHMEAGNRCFDLKVPEEINRMIIDSISHLAIPYTPNSRENLLKEGIPKERIIISGNPINEVLDYYKYEIDSSKIMNFLGLDSKRYFLATFHRSENVDIKERLEQIINGLDAIGFEYHMPIVCSIHPRTRDKMNLFKMKPYCHDIMLCEPFSFFDFTKLEKNASLVITDSGTVQEECCIFQVPTVTIRDSTERPETLECGSNIISGINAKKILDCVTYMLSYQDKWKLPIGYDDLDVSSKIIKILMGKN